MNPNQLLLLALYVTHYLSIAVWVGVMLFNLIVNFPAMRSRANTPGEFTAAMAAQAQRAGPWLYALVVLTFGSGLILQWIGTAPAPALPTALVTVKVACLALMLLLHLYGTFRLWPQIYFALDTERGALLVQYQVAMVLSAAFGIVAVVASFLPRVT